jgi:nicotinate-nucleotide adenylyltransferase
MNKPKVGFYSGTFDPVHVGHIEFALEALRQADLFKVLLLPETTPREKEGVTHLSQRIDMLKMACEPYDALEVKTLPNEQFTVQHTLPLLQEMYPSNRLVFLCGSDVVKTFLYRWEGLTTLLEQTDVIIGLRGNDTKQDMAKIFDELKASEGIAARYIVLRSPRHHLAATMVRNNVHTIDDLNPAVAAYIVTNDLYS